MKLIAQLQLKPSREQSDVLRRTLGTANEACNHLSEIAWSSKTFGQFALQKLGYAETRSQFGLSAQMAVRCIAKVADAYKLDKKTKRRFKPTGAIAYDTRILRIKLALFEVSIWTMNGRQTIPFVCGERQRKLLETQQGECDLVLFKGRWFLLAPCNVEEAEPIDIDGHLGIDLGIVNISADSDGEVHRGTKVNNVRHRHRRLRSKLQKKRTKSAKRLLKKLSGKERRFATDTNHCISKHIVAKAQRTKRAIALEVLQGIRKRVRVRKSQRAALNSWSFYQLATFITYKAKRCGVPVVKVDPRNTSRECPECGHIAKQNRISQSKFLCVSCGFAGPADTIASGNIARRAEVNRPYVPRLTLAGQAA